MPARITFTTTNTMELLKRSACSPASRLAATARRKVRWAWTGATIRHEGPAVHVRDQLSRAAGHRCIATMGKDGFSDVSWPAKIAQPNFPHGGLGHRALRHGQRRLAGHFRRQRPRVSRKVDSVPRRDSTAEPIQLFRNRRDGTLPGCFQCACRTYRTKAGGGGVLGDLNNDGNIDVVMVNVGAPPTCPAESVRERQSSCACSSSRGAERRAIRSAIGARVTVRAGQAGAVQRGPRQGEATSHRTIRGCTLAWERKPRIERSGNQVAQRQGGSAARCARQDFIYTIVEGQGIADKTSCRRCRSPVVPYPGFQQLSQRRFVLAQSSCPSRSGTTRRARRHRQSALAPWL